VRGGFVGVDIFFVISGYLISKIIIGNLEKGSFSFADFYSRRVRRIFPALATVLGACALAGWFVLLPAEYDQLGKHIAGGAAFVSNLVLLSESGYFDSSAVTKPLLHLWSLGIEEQFYILWPVLLWLARKRQIALLIGAVLVGSFVLDLAVLGDHPVAAFYSPFTRFW
jgi:peptidoglycan/LPS O-acetylase OafA/YrhL